MESDDVDGLLASILDVEPGRCQFPVEASTISTSPFPVLPYALPYSPSALYLTPPDSGISSCETTHQNAEAPPAGQMSETKFVDLLLAFDCSDCNSLSGACSPSSSELRPSKTVDSGISAASAINPGQLQSLSFSTPVNTDSGGVSSRTPGSDAPQSRILSSETRSTASSITAKAVQPVPGNSPRRNASSQGAARRYKILESSKFCHICVRSGEMVPLAPCGNVLAGMCRKSVCRRCLEKHGRENEWIHAQENTAALSRNASAPSEGSSTTASTLWTCLHCRKVCPDTASCKIYARTNRRRHLQRKNKRAGKVHIASPKARGRIGNQGPWQQQEKQSSASETVQLLPNLYSSSNVQARTGAYPSQTGLGEGFNHTTFRQSYTQHGQTNPAAQTHYRFENVFNTIRDDRRPSS